VTIASPGSLRSRRLVRAGFSSLAARMGGVVLALVLTPVIVRALGDERYGVYATITTVVGLLAFSDLGVGNGLVARLAAADGHGDQERQRRLVSTALAVLAVGGALIGVLASLVAITAPWPDLFGSSTIPVEELRSAVLVFGLLFAASLPAGLGQKVLLGLQRGGEASAWLLASTVAALALTAVAAFFDAGLTLVVAATLAPPVCLGAAQSVWLFRLQHPELRPRLGDVSRSDITELLRIGGLFVLLNLAGAVAFQTDLFVVSGVLGATSAAVFAICLRLFGLVVHAVTAALSQLWPAFAEALACDDDGWVGQTLLRTMAATAVLVVPAVVLLVIVAQDMIRWWVGPSLVPPTALLIAMACWTVQQCAIYPLAMLMNGAEMVRFQVVAASSMAVTNVLVSIVLARQIGISGPVWASLLTHLVLNAAPAVVVVRRRLLTPATSPSTDRERV